MTRILFVCMGNICRSPTAEGVFRHLVREHSSDLTVEIDSAGTHAYHVGEPPDPRSQEAARRRGFDLSAIRARKVSTQDFDDFDLILAMDQLNLLTLMDICPPENAHKLALFLDQLDDEGQRDVPDPYYGGDTGFEQVLDLVEKASLSLIESLIRSLAGQAGKGASGT
ncbi:MAG: low molecular weight phosphotyrosine protein phosphatase [Gammaproteobacteria bacterium]|nr:low molecular weight phosphotyrosine protein phosphatase [Gammaproteobacteria bacterium]